jgi:hypothetical protein
MQHYVIKFVSDLQQVGGFLWAHNNKIARHDITEILLKVALNTIALTLNCEASLPINTYWQQLLINSPLMGVDYNNNYSLTHHWWEWIITTITH